MSPTLMVLLWLLQTAPAAPLAVPSPAESFADTLVVTAARGEQRLGLSDHRRQPRGPGPHACAPPPLLLGGGPLPPLAKWIRDQRIYA